MVIVMLMCIYILSAISGVNKGIQCSMESISVLGCFATVYISRIGPTRFILNSFGKGMTLYSTNLFHMAICQMILFGWVRGPSSFGAGFGLWTDDGDIYISDFQRSQHSEIIFMLSVLAPLVTNFGLQSRVVQDWAWN